MEVNIANTPKIPYAMDRMTMSTHVAVGASIGLITQNPVLGFVSGCISHFLLDMIPHGDSTLGESHFNTKKKSIRPYLYVLVDNGIAIYLLLAIVNIVPKESLFAVSAGVAGSILPDVLVGVYEASRRKWLKKFFKMHLAIHNVITNKIGDIPLVVGVGYQVVGIVLILGTIRGL